MQSSVSVFSVFLRSWTYAKPWKMVKHLYSWSRCPRWLLKQPEHLREPTASPTHRVSRAEDPSSPGGRGKTQRWVEPAGIGAVLTMTEDGVRSDTQEVMPNFSFGACGYFVCWKKKQPIIRRKEEVWQHTVASRVCSCAFFWMWMKNWHHTKEKPFKKVFPDGHLDAHIVSSHICMPVWIAGGWRALHSNVFFVSVFLAAFQCFPPIHLKDKHMGLSNGVTVDTLWSLW